MSANQVDDDEARKKLIDKINRVAANLGEGKAMPAAAEEVLREQGMILSEAETAAGGRRGERALSGGGRLFGFLRNPLKCPNSDE